MAHGQVSDIEQLFLCVKTSSWRLLGCRDETRVLRPQSAQLCDAAQSSAVGRGDVKPVWCFHDEGARLGKCLEKLCGEFLSEKNFGEWVKAAPQRSEGEACGSGQSEAGVRGWAVRG